MITKETNHIKSQEIGVLPCLIKQLSFVGDLKN